MRLGLLLAMAWAGGMRATGAAAPVFRAASDGGFEFDTGELRGRLRRGGQSVGLQEVVAVRAGLRLDHSQGLLSHYRVFTRGRRYGGGAWDWASRAELTSDGAVQVVWPSQGDRPFELRATYRWLDPRTVELTTEVRARAALEKFESFVASYFSESFTNARVRLGSSAQGRTKDSRWISVTREGGDWQVFPRDARARTLLQDGRWKLEPNPVDWTIREYFGTEAVAERRSVRSGLGVRLEAGEESCFALALPYETEGHRSLYLSLFGNDLEAGQVAQGRVRWALHSAGDGTDRPPSKP